MAIKLFLLIIVMLIFLFIIFLFVLSIINSMIYWVPQVWTFKSDIEIMKIWLKKYNLSWKKIIDLWSWTWKTLRFLEKYFEAKLTWYEIDLFNYLLSRFLNKIFWLNANIKKDDFLKANLQDFDFIYIYWFPKLMDKYENFIFSKAKKWTIIFSNAFKFKNKIPIEILVDKAWIPEMYIYKI